MRAGSPSSPLPSVPRRPSRRRPSPVSGDGARTKAFYFEQVQNVAGVPRALLYRSLRTFVGRGERGKAYLRMRAGASGVGQDKGVQDMNGKTTAASALVVLQLVATHAFAQ